MTGYGGGIFPQHADMLAASGITPEHAHVRGYQSVDTKKRLEGVGITLAGRRVPGLLIPLLRLDGSTWGFQYRPDDPRTGARTVKYETPTGQRNDVDVPPGVGPLLCDPTVPLWVTEGTKKADAAALAGLACVALPGVWSWKGTNDKGGKVAVPGWHDVALNGRRVVLAFDSDVIVKRQVRKALTALAEYLASKGALVEYLHLPHDDDAKTGLDDYLADGHSVDELLRLVRPDLPEPVDVSNLDTSEQPSKLDSPDRAENPHVEPVPMADALATFQRWMHLPDLDPLLVVAAAAVANLSPERSPLWLLVIGPPSSGKTEVINGLTRLPQAIYAATVTESALLSGTSKAERAADATGGLLRRIPSPGILVMKDFGSVLSMNRDARAAAMAALREVYDGSWTRAVGSDGGRLLEWRGKVGLIAGGTTSYDRHHGVIAALGDRFVIVRLADLEADAAGLSALTHAGREGTMREQLDAALAGLVMSADATRVRDLTDDERRELVRLARFTGTARTGIERDGYTQELLVMPAPEGPGRLVVALRQVLAGLWAIGCDDATAWRIVRRVARDTVPALRTTVLTQLMTKPEPRRTSDIAAACDLVTKTAHRILDDLALVGLVDRGKQSAADNSPDLWSPSGLLVALWPGSETETLVRVDTPTDTDTSALLLTEYMERDISVSLCPHGVEGGDKPDEWVGGLLACTECRRDSMAVSA